jgi:hypothetical protein
MATHRILAQLWADDRGNLLSTEFMLMATILIIGVIAGLVLVRDSVVTQMEQYGMAIDCLPVFSPDDAEDPTSSDCAPGPDVCSTVTAVPATPCNLLVAPCP